MKKKNRKTRSFSEIFCQKTIWIWKRKKKFSMILGKKRKKFQKKSFRNPCALRRRKSSLDEELLSEEEELERFIDSMSAEEDTDALNIVSKRE